MAELAPTKNGKKAKGTGYWWKAQAQVASALREWKVISVDTVVCII